MKDKLTREELYEMAKTQKSLSDMGFDDLKSGMLFNYYIWFSGGAYLQSPIRIGYKADKVEKWKKLKSY